MRIRDRTDADLAACGTLLLRVREATGYPVRRLEDPVAWLSGVGRAWVAEDDGELAGHVALTPRGGGAAVERLYVDPARARTGIGSTLLLTATAHAAAEGRTAVLDVVDRPGPLAFYATLGWRETGRSAVDWAGGRELVHLARRHDRYLERP